MPKQIFSCWSLPESCVAAGWMTFAFESISFLFNMLVLFDLMPEHILYYTIVEFYYDLNIALSVMIKSILLITCLMMIQGVKSNNRRLMLPWMLVIAPNFSTMITIALWALVYQINGYDTEWEFYTEITLRFAIGGFFLYLWYGVLCLYRIMYNEEKDAAERRVPMEKSDDLQYVNIEE